MEALENLLRTIDDDVSRGVERVIREAIEKLEAEKRRLCEPFDAKIRELQAILRPPAPPPPQPTASQVVPKPAAAPAPPPVSTAQPQQALAPQRSVSLAPPPPAAQSPASRPAAPGPVPRGREQRRYYEFLRRNPTASYRELVAGLEQEYTEPNYNKARNVIRAMRSGGWLDGEPGKWTLLSGGTDEGEDDDGFVVLRPLQ